LKSEGQKIDTHWKKWRGNWPYWPGLLQFTSPGLWYESSYMVLKR